jgi:hypothetical protein
MIHEVRLTRETKIYLWQVVRLQLDVLSCTVNLSPGFTQFDMQSALENKMLSARAEQVAEWVFGHKTPGEALQEFAKGSNPDRRALFDAMRQDILRLYWGRRDETLECCFDDDKKLPDYQKGAKSFLIGFYEQLGSGVDVNLFLRNPSQHYKYGREQFFAAYERENPTQHVCAICDEHRPITILRGEYFSDIEHYFPKSVYPHLACHPYNLIPMCKPCNSAHGIKDPLVGTTRRTLGEVFLPYRNESVRLQGTVKFEWNKHQSPSLSIDERQINPNNAFRTKLEAFEVVYDIPKRWQNRIHQIGEQLWRQMSYFVRVEIGKGEKLDPLQAKTALERLLNYFIEDLGASPWDYVLVWYLSHLLVVEVEEAIKTNKASDEIALLQALQDVITNQPPSHTHRLGVDEVLETSRKLYAQPNLP